MDLVELEFQAFCELLYVGPGNWTPVFMIEAPPNPEALTSLSSFNYSDFGGKQFSYLFLQTIILF